MRIRACIFDLDGVLVDTMGAHFRAWSTTADLMNVRITEEELQGFRGRRRSECLDVLVAKAGPVTAAEYERLLSAKDEIYRALLAGLGDTILVRGTPDLLRALRTGGYGIGLASASRNAAAIVAQAGLEGAFDAVSDGHFAGPAKPAPDQIAAVADRLGCPAAAAVVFDDAHAGIAAAVGAGAYAVGIGGTLRGHEGMHGWLESLAGAGPAEMQEFLERLAKRVPTVAR